MKSTLKKSLIYTFFFINLLIIFTFWRHGSASLISISAGNAFLALGRLFGLFAVYSILLQVLIMGRVRWLESLFGPDKLSVAHRKNGYIAMTFIILHPIFLVIGYSLLSHTRLMTQFLAFLIDYKFVFISLIGTLLFIAVVASSIIVAKKKLKYETWNYIHITVYAAILLAYFHQIAVGGDFVQAGFIAYWIGLYLFILANLFIYRFIKPLYANVKHRFVVERVVKETDNAVSIYITGNSMNKFHVNAGQFIFVRFLSKALRGQVHPFSISGIDQNTIRITVKNLGDFTKKIQEFPALEIGTRVYIDGPHGKFTLESSQKDKQKFLFLAAGVGITPMKAMLEVCRKNDFDAVLLYGNRTKKDVIFQDELTQITNTCKNIKVRTVLSDPDNTWKGECGRIDEEKIRRLVCDIKDREIYLCGPPPMMKSMLLLLKYLEVNDKNVHYERFSM